MSWIIWLILTLVLLAIELIVPELVSVWFSLAALVLSIFTAIFPKLHWGWEILIFAVLSAVLVASTRNIVKRILKRRGNQETNLDLILNHIAIVEEEIDNDRAVGSVKINGLIWSARAENGEKISAGEFVIVKEIHGNKLVVKIKEEKEEK